jgi:phage shock protein A
MDPPPPDRKGFAMGIFDRMGKVIQSNLNALLEKAEDDKKLIELNLDEMDAQIKAGHQEVVQAVAAEKQLRKKFDELTADVERWDKRAELALRSGDEALAREALKQKKRAEAESITAESARSQQRDAALRMKEELERMKQKLSELKLRKGTMVTRAQQARGGSGAERLGAKGGGGAFENFRRMEEKIEGREVEGAAMAEVDEALGSGAKADDLEAKFRDLERQTGAGGTSGTEVDDELAALKKRIRV